MLWAVGSVGGWEEVGFLLASILWVRLTQQSQRLKPHKVGGIES